MTTVILTGRDFSLDIGAATYDAQASGVTLTQELNRETYELLAGRVRKVLDDDGAISVTMMSDWGEVGGLCAALWTAADTSPDTSLVFSFEANGDTFGGKVFPVKPDVAAEGNDASIITLELPLDGAVTRTPAAV